MKEKFNCIKQFGNMRNINKVLLTVVIVLVVMLIGVVVWQTWLSGPAYYAVYMRTGDLYFGQLSNFPSYGLSHVYMLQVNSQNSQNPVSVQKFSNVFWGPEDFIHLNHNDVVWSAKLSSDSQLVKLITTNPDLVSSQTQQQPSAPQQIQGGNATSSVK